MPEEFQTDGPPVLLSAIATSATHAAIATDPAGAALASGTPKGRDEDARRAAAAATAATGPGGPATARAAVATRATTRTAVKQRRIGGRIVAAGTLEAGVAGCAVSAWQRRALTRQPCAKEARSSAAIPPACGHSANAASATDAASPTAARTVQAGLPAIAG